MTDPYFSGGVPQPYSPTQDEKNMAMFAHFGHLLAGPLVAIVMFFVKKDSAWVRNECKKVINFSLTLYFCVILAFVAVFVGLVVILNGNDDRESAFRGVAGIGGVCLTYGLLFTAGIYSYVMPIVNGIRVSSGSTTKYPLSIPFCGRTKSR